MRRSVFEATQVVLGLEMEVPAMETKTRQDAMEYRTRGDICPLTLRRKIAHHFSTTFGAVTDGEDAMVTLRVAHSCDHICLVQLKKKGLIRTLL